MSKLIKKNTFEEILEKDGTLIFKTRGVSMEPMLRQDRDLVIIKKAHGRLKRFDVALYKRKNKYVLHRVIHVRENDYAIRGDNTYSMEYGITDDDIIGVLTGFIRKGKNCSVSNRKYLAYVRIWNFIFPLRFCYISFRHFCGKIFHKIFPKTKKQK